jgi:hypothetical protein
MAILTATQIAQLGVELLARSLVLTATVSRVAEADYTGSGGTVTVRVRQPRAAQTQTPGTQITFSTVNEVGVNVALAHLYEAVLLTDEDLNLKLEDFGRQILQPSIASVAEAAEGKIAAAMNALTPSVEFSATASAADTKGVILEARETMSTAKVPAGQRYLAVSPSIATRLLSVDEFVKANESGSTSALRDAIIGRVLGFTVVESPALTADEAVAYHKSGFVFASKAPAPAASADSSSISEGGVALRAVRDFDPNVLSEIAVVSTFAGAAAVNDVTPASDPADFPRLVKLGVGSS